MIQKLFFALVMLVAALPAAADDAVEINPTAIHYEDDGTEVSVGDSSVNAPYSVHFYANPSNADDYTANYEWRFYKDGSESTYLVRYEEDTEYTFTESGSYSYVLYAYFYKNGELAVELNSETKTIVVKESILTMPNAFSPNGDGFNDVYKPIQYQSLTEFHAYIYNRWGQMLFDWTDPSTGWDGTYKGKDVKDGVYFCLVKAKGGDGVTYNIKKDVTLLRGYYNESSTSTTEE